MFFCLCCVILLLMSLCFVIGIIVCHMLYVSWVMGDVVGNGLIVVC